MGEFPIYRQLETTDCGPACLHMIAKYYGRIIPLSKLKTLCSHTREGVSLSGISKGAEAIGFKTLKAKIPFENLKKDLPVPFIVHWRGQHFVVVYAIKRDKIYVADPAFGRIKYNETDFIRGWLDDKTDKIHGGVVFLLEPTPEFYKLENEKQSRRTGISELLVYLKPYKKLVVQLIIGMIIGSLLQLLLPLMTQSLVDIGINYRNINFVNLILFAQLALYISRYSVEFIRGWILLHIGSRVNLSILSSFLSKLMRLPISFFESKLTGDLIQRLSDQKRVETFLTGSVLTAVFSFVNLVIFCIVLVYYDVLIFTIFLLGSVLYFIWIVAFMKKRRELDYRQFNAASSSQTTIIQLISGMQEIKLQSVERQKRWDWESFQAILFKINVKGLKLNQVQQGGSIFINEVKNLVITYLSVKAVIHGEISLGMMLAIQFIIGQLNAPILDLVNFIKTFQDARLSLERLNEIHSLDDEESINQSYSGRTLDQMHNKDIALRNINFRYVGTGNVLHDINMIIPHGKITAIVGHSGSGKTTLIKLLLKFYDPSDGDILVGDVNLKYIQHSSWRSRCGAVMQDGFIFSDTIANNICVNEEDLDIERLIYASKMANIFDFVASLPLNFNTTIGADGIGLSFGQRQRLLIARAVYKDPEYFFLDEATNSLDSSNEKTIMTNLENVFVNRTVIVVAHRLGTVMNADKIIVLEKGRIVEEGTHSELYSNRSHYYHLVSNQLPIGV